MNYLEQKNLLSKVAFKIFHEVHDYKDYYFCFMRRKELTPIITKLLDKHQSISKKDFQKFCHSQTADVMEMADDPENDAYVYFIDILDIRSDKYIQQSLFLYKHIANIVSFKLFNSYYDEETFKSDLEKVLNPNDEFKYIKRGKISPSGMEIAQGYYDMTNSHIKNKEEDRTNNYTKTRTPDEALHSHQQNKNTLEKEFNIQDFAKLGAKNKEEDLADIFFNKVDNTASFVSDVVFEASKNIKQTVVDKAPVVKKNATIVGKFLGKKIIKVVNDGTQIIEKKIKEDKIKKLKHNDLFYLDLPDPPNTKILKKKKAPSKPKDNKNIKK